MFPRPDVTFSVATLSTNSRFSEFLRLYLCGSLRWASTARSRFLLSQKHVRIFPSFAWSQAPFTAPHWYAPTPRSQVLVPTSFFRCKLHTAQKLSAVLFTKFPVYELLKNITQALVQKINSADT